MLESVNGVCGGVRRVLRRWQLREDAITDAVVIVGELVANAVEDARTEWQVVVTVRGSCLVIAVDDGMVGVRFERARPCLPYVSGLRVVNAVALRWGWQEHESGKTVWAEIWN